MHQNIACFVFPPSLPFMVNRTERKFVLNERNFLFMHNYFCQAQHSGNKERGRWSMSYCVCTCLCVCMRGCSRTCTLMENIIPETCHVLQDITHTHQCQHKNQMLVATVSQDTTTLCIFYCWWPQTHDTQ